MENTLEAISSYTLPDHAPKAGGGLVQLGNDKYILVTQMAEGDTRIAKVWFTSVGRTTHIATVTGNLRPQWNQVNYEYDETNEHLSLTWRSNPIQLRVGGCNQNFVRVTHITPLLVEGEEEEDLGWDWMVRHRSCLIVSFVAIGGVSASAVLAAMIFRICCL